MRKQEKEGRICRKNRIYKGKLEVNYKMGASKGNQNAKGHDGTGTGRKPLPVEMAMRKKEEDLLYQPQDLEEVQKRIKQKKYSVRDAMLAKELSGNETLIGKHYHKVIPDKVDLGGEGSFEFIWKGKKLK